MSSIDNETTKLFQKTIGKILEILDDSDYLANSTGNISDYFEKAKNSIKTELWHCHDIVKLRIENSELKSKLGDQ